jgi:diguanylate cyclase (GGDEF)-like protein/PAS domain S-box-containing protein
MGPQRKIDYEGRYRRLVENSIDAILTIDLRGSVLEANAAVRPILGYSPDELLGTALDQYFTSNEAQRMREGISAIVGGASNARADFEVVARDGSRRFVDAVGYPILKDGRVGAIMVIARDMTRRAEREETLVHQATFDWLTGVPNRALLMDRLEHALSRVERSRKQVGVLMFDLDSFKNVNKEWLLAGGDAVLRGVATSVASSLRSGDTVMRYGGDEFVVVVDEVTSVAELTLLARRILEAVNEPITFEGRTQRMTASLGIALSNVSDDATSIMSRANAVMNELKDHRSTERAGYRGGWQLASD